MTVTMAPGQAPTIETSKEQQAYLRRRRRGRFFAARVVLAIVITVVMFFPLYWMLLTAFSTRRDLYAPGLHWWPQHFTLDNFRNPIDQFPVKQWFWNSLVIAVLTTVLSVSVNLLAGYAFAKMRFRGKNAIFLLLLSTMMIPVQSIMVSQFKLAVKLGLYGNIWAVILPESAAVFGIFLARQFFMAIPDELIEAARVDGAGQLRTFVSVVLPLCKPLVAVMTLLTFSNEWNAFSWPLIVLFSNQQAFTLPIGMVTDLQSQFGSDYGAVMAISLVSIAPMVVLFIAFQKYFVQGMARSGIK